jgi:zinc transport system permease protein
MSEFFSLFSLSIYASILLAIAIAIAGSIMLITRSSYIAASIAHGSYGGVGLALFLGTPLLPTTLAFAIALALILAWITLKNPARKDLLIGTIWAVGMSLGILFIDLTPGYNTDLLAYLFGNILLVSQEDLWFLLITDLVLVVAAAIFYNHILAVAYDTDFARVRGIKVGLIHTLTILLLALAVIASIRAVGLILVIALFSIPPFIAEKLAKNVVQMIAISAFLALLFLAAGLAASYYFNVSATAATILAAAFGFILSLKVKA